MSIPVEAMHSIVRDDFLGTAERMIEADEFFNDVKISIWGSRSKWYIEDGSVYYERIYKNNDEWETAINSLHKPSKIKARNFRFEIVKEQERQG